MRISENRLRAIIRGIVKESIQPTTKRRNLRESDPMMSNEYDGGSYPDDEEFAYDGDVEMDDSYIPPDIESDEMGSTYGVPVDDSELTGVEPLSQEYGDEEYGDYEDELGDEGL